MSAVIVIQLVAGFVLLIAGAEGLVRGASRIALALGIPPLIIGLTVVALGTSSPELAVSIGASVTGRPDITVGNVIGSNILNVLFILGVSAALIPLVVQRQLVRLDVPIMIAASVAAWLFALDGQVNRLEGGLLFAGLLAYVGFLFNQLRQERGTEVEAQYEEKYRRAVDMSARTWVANVGLVVGGLAVLALGSHWLVAGATAIAELLGVSQLIIGLTIVAVGTSLPEVATSILASIRGERDIAVGNAVGSNIFNLLAVLGLSALVAPVPLRVNTAAIHFDLPVMVAVALACLPIFFTGSLIARWEGFLFLGYYAAYTVYLILYAQQHDALPLFSDVMLLFVIPLTVLTLVVITWRAFGRQRTASRASS
ncbi:MAG: calcium/sodium antiporter [Chloroflexota bacterium]|nr:calcium/sodium antiporter [Chloroflexota bacterium]